MATCHFEGISEYIQLLMKSASPDIRREIVTELGLFLEREVKLGTPVDYGRLRASWGHYTPGDLQKGGGGSSAGDAVWEFKESGSHFSVEVGTNVNYAPYVEFGHHSYPGAHMLEKGLLRTERQVEPTVVSKLRGIGWE